MQTRRALKGAAAEQESGSSGSSSSSSWAEGFRSMGSKGKQTPKGGSGGKGDAPEPPNQSEIQGLMTTGLALAILWGFFKGNDERGEEINFQTFKSKLLARGEVERLIIVNKSTVKVVLRPDSTVQPGSFNSQSQQQQRSGSNRWGDDPATSGYGSEENESGFYRRDAGEKTSISRGYSGPTSGDKPNMSGRRPRIDTSTLR